MSQPPPVPSDRPRIADRVIEDIADRTRRGVREYGSALQAHNGRRALQDLYEELLDGAHYVRQRIDEEDNTLREVAGDESVRASLADIYDRCEVVRKNLGKINREAVERRYLDDVAYMRAVVEALLAELMSARATPPPPPESTEVALYQYRCVAPDGWIGYDPESYDQNHVDDWCADQTIMSEGYYMEYRPLYGSRWYRVDPERPPVQPETSGYGPAGPEPARDDGRPHGSLLAGAVLGGTDDGRLRIYCPRCEWDAVYSSLDLPTLAQIAADHAAELHPD